MVSISQAVLEKMFETVDGRTDDGEMPDNDYTISSPGELLGQVSYK